MKRNKNLLSLSTKGIKYNLKIAFYLMSILPLLVCIYLVSNYIFPAMGIKLEIALSVVISIFIATIGFFLVKKVFDRVTSLSSDAKLIAAGDIERKVEIISEDEIGDLGNALNQLTRRIRSNMDELKTYGEKTTQINLQIQKRVIVLSSLLQLSSLISQSAKLEDILELTTEKSRLLANSDVSFLLLRESEADAFHMQIVDGINSESFSGVTVSSEEGIFNRLITKNKEFIVDRENLLPEDVKKKFYEKFKLENALALPVYLKGKVMGILGVGNNRKNFSYAKEDTELLDLFAKQTAIAIENDALLHRIEKLEIKDTLTGLYNAEFIRSRLQEEIKRAIAYRRPCSFILLDVDNFKEFHQRFGALYAEPILKKIAILINDSVSEIDRVGRTGDNELSVILPERNKRQAHEIAENIRKKIEFIFSEEQDINKRLTLSGGVSENPIDGINAEELVSKARESLELAKKQGKNRIIG